MKNTNKKKYKSKPIEKKHPEPKRDADPIKPPKENLNGLSNRFIGSASLNHK